MTIRTSGVHAGFSGYYPCAAILLVLQALPSSLLSAFLPCSQARTASRNCQRRIISLICACCLDEFLPSLCYSLVAIARIGIGSEQIVYLFVNRFFLCSSGWPPTCSPLASTSKCWDYMHIPTCPAFGAFLIPFTVELSMHLQGERHGKESSLAAGTVCYAQVG